MIYLDNFFPVLIKPGVCSFYDDYAQVPYGCKIIGKTFYDGNHDQHKEIIKELLPKTDKLILIFVEAVEENFVDFLKELTDSKISLIINAIIDDQTIKADNVIAWFASPLNFYNKQSGHTYLLSLVDQIVHSNIKPKYFDCLLGRLKYHRTQIEKFYQTSQHRDKIIFSYFKHDNQIVDGLWDIDVKSIHSTMAPVDKYNIPLNSILPISIYNQSYYSIVAETTCYNSHNQYTEKLIKPIVARRLFVAFASKNYLSNLKNLGFKTFDSVIDETYDSVDDLDLRMKMAWDQVEWLCEQDPVEILAKIQPIVEHNYNHFVTTDWMASIRKHFAHLG